MNNEKLLAKCKALFPDNVEAIVVRKDDYDRLYGDLTIENIKLKQEIERLNNIINELEEGIKYMWVDDAGEDTWQYKEEVWLSRKEFLDKIKELKGVDKE